MMIIIITARRMIQFIDHKRGYLIRGGEEGEEGEGGEGEGEGGEKEEVEESHLDIVKFYHKILCDLTPLFFYTIYNSRIILFSFQSQKRKKRNRQTTTKSIIFEFAFLFLTIFLKFKLIQW